jgi:hypothetical protein
VEPDELRQFSETKLTQDFEHPETFIRNSEIKLIQVTEQLSTEER